MALNAKQNLFVKAYLVEKNATRAAKEAGYSAKTAYSMGARLLKHVEVAQAIADGVRKQERVLELRAIENGITKERWLKELSRIAMADIRDVAETPQTEWDPAVSAAVKTVKISKYGLTTFEMHSKQAALDTLGRACGWLKDDMNLRLPDTVQVRLTMPANGSESLPQHDEQQSSESENVSDSSKD